MTVADGPCGCRLRLTLHEQLSAILTFANRLDSKDLLGGSICDHRQGPPKATVVDFSVVFCCYWSKASFMLASPCGAA